MIQNVKVDVIYFKTQTDFEMEFNLSGCCRMRLLTDKAPDKKILINQLVRAVSRSRIIIITGALFGDDNIIETAAKAIGRPTAKLNNNQFGIDKNEDIDIIKDSIPLVSSDGIFGGCIIEQGPQTLILLSENKNIRKNIMNNLIHAYIKELCTEDASDDLTIPLTEEQIAETETIEEPENEIQDLTEEDLVLETEEDVSETEDAEELSDNETEDEPLPLIFDEDDEEEMDEEDLKIAEALIIDNEQSDVPVQPIESDSALTEDLFTDIFSEKQADDEIDFDFTKEAEMFVTDEDDEPKLWSGINIPIIILIALLTVVICILAYSIFIVPASEGVSAGEYLKETYDILFS